MDSPAPSNIPVVLITGFGPFRNVLVNPSWEIAKALKTDLEWRCPVHIIIQQLQVTYDDVSNRVPDYWLKYNPNLVVHIGVASGTREIRIERRACNNEYCYPDNNGTTPVHSQCVRHDAPDDLATLLPIDDVCARVARRTQTPVKTSSDAGRFLCEFIYYQSLFIDRKRTVFIHVPDIDEDFTLENLARTIQLIIYELIGCVDPLPALNQNGNYLINPTSKKSVAVDNGN